MCTHGIVLRAGDKILHIPSKKFLKRTLEISVRQYGSLNMPLPHKTQKLSQFFY